MAKKQISTVSLDEIQATRNENEIPKANELNKTNKTYLSRLKDTEIAEFFKPFDFISFNRGEEIGFNNMAVVVCNNFSVVFTDYDIIVQFFNPTLPNSSFDLNAFLDYCESINTTPEKAMADLVQINLLGQRFHSYNKNFTKIKQDERKLAFNSLPKSLKPMLKTLDQKREHELDGISTKLSYGDFIGDPQAKKTF